MERTANNTFGNQIYRYLPKAGYFNNFSRYFKLIVFVGFVIVSTLVLQIASLEIPNRYGIFPLYGFYLFNLTAVVALSAYLLLSTELIELLKRKVVRRPFLKRRIKEIPAVILIIRHQQIETPKSNSAKVK